MDLSQLELHDANLLGVSLDPVTGTAEIRLSFYPPGEARERVLGVLSFRRVTRLNQIVDFALLKQHAAFGNVTQFVTGEQPGKPRLRRRRRRR
jgi:hypothetical protein